MHHLQSDLFVTHFKALFNCSVFKVSGSHYVPPMIKHGKKINCHLKGGAM